MMTVGPKCEGVVKNEDRKMKINTYIHVPKGVTQ